MEVQKVTHLVGPFIIQYHSLTIHMKGMSRKILFILLASLRRKRNFPPKLPEEMMNFQER